MRVRSDTCVRMRQTTPVIEAEFRRRARIPRADAGRGAGDPCSDNKTFAWDSKHWPALYDGTIPEDWPFRSIVIARCITRSCRALPVRTPDMTDIDNPCRRRPERLDHLAARTIGVPEQGSRRGHTGGRQRGRPVEPDLEYWHSVIRRASASASVAAATQAPSTWSRSFCLRAISVLRCRGVASNSTAGPPLPTTMVPADGSPRAVAGSGRWSRVRARCGRPATRVPNSAGPSNSGVRGVDSALAPERPCAAMRCSAGDGVGSAARIGDI